MTQTLFSTAPALVFGLLLLTGCAHRAGAPAAAVEPWGSYSAMEVANLIQLAGADWGSDYRDGRYDAPPISWLRSFRAALPVNRGENWDCDEDAILAWAQALRRHPGLNGLAVGVLIVEFPSKRRHACLVAICADAEVWYLDPTFERLRRLRPALENREFNWAKVKWI